MKYEIRRDRVIQEDSPNRTTIKYDEPQWIIYYEGRENISPLMVGFDSVLGALKHFIDGIGTNEGIVRIKIETLKPSS